MKAVLPCAVYARKSSEEGLEQGFNSLDAQREACEAFILSQKEQGWKAITPAYEDGGFSGGNIERPGLKRLLADVATGRVRIVVVYKVDRLTRSLADFAKLVELFDAHQVSFVSVTQQFNTTTSMGRLTLNVLLSFAQFEREVTGERIRDKIAASKRKGLWMGGIAPIGYLPHERTLVIDEPQAKRIRDIYRLYLDLGCVRELQKEVARRGWITPPRKTLRLEATGKRPFSRGHLYRILSNPIYIGHIAHKGAVYTGQHPAIVEIGVWQAVQEKLSTNLQGHRTRATAANPSLLAGLLFDEHGQGLTPTHAKKGAKRYRYYVGRALHSAGRNAAPDALRWPAQELEEVVLKSLVNFLSDEPCLLELMGTVDTKQARGRLKHAGGLAEQLSDDKFARQLDVLGQIVSQISVLPDKIRIAVHTDEVWGLKLSPNDPADEQKPTTWIDVPVVLKRSGMSVRLIVRAPGTAEPRKSDPKLVALIAKAHDWFARIASGRSDSLLAISREEKVSSPYVARVVHLAFLAPDIVQQISQGHIPMDLNSDRLIRMVPLPIAWDAQRALLGMPT